MIKQGGLYLPEFNDRGAWNPYYGCGKRCYKIWLNAATLAQGSSNTIACHTRKCLWETT